MIFMESRNVLVIGVIAFESDLLRLKIKSMEYIMDIPIEFIRRIVSNGYE